MNILVKMDDLGVPWGTHIFAASISDLFRYAVAVNMGQ